jgi:pilus assembly protein CpaF
VLGFSQLTSEILPEVQRELGREFSTRGTPTEGEMVSESQITTAVDKVLQRRGNPLSEIQRAELIVHLKTDLVGWGTLQALIDNPSVTDIHVYDYQTVVLQRGKSSEVTGLHWPNRQSYVAFVDRLLLSLGRSLSNQQHTIDASLPNGIRICAVHESVCGCRGPLLSIRIPRIKDARLETLVSFQLAPQGIVDYLYSLVKSCQVTMIIAGETGTGKTTLLRCLGTGFGDDESIVAVEDTPELNFTHPFFRSLVSRPANVEGTGEVSLDEHIKTTLRMTPTRVILGEMRTPLAAEAFLESAQTGHTGLSTIHSRNARETLVRLESLLGRAQKSVAVDIIRSQIALAVDVIVWLFREKGTGTPRVGEVIEVGHFVEGAIQVRPIFSFKHGESRPVWKVESWASAHQNILAASGVHLNRYAPELSFDTPTYTEFARQVQS